MANRFQDIMYEALDEAEGVDVPADAFKRGLASMWHILNRRCEQEDVDPVAMASDGELDDED